MLNAARTAVYPSLDHAVKAGGMLLEAKAAVDAEKPGTWWAGWEDHGFEFSYEMAQVYMKLYRRRDEFANLEHVTSIRSALRALG